MERQEKVNDNLPYDNYVLLPQLKEVHDRFSSGFFDRETWNMLVDLYLRLPEKIQQKISFNKLAGAENNKQMCLILFTQIKYYLEESGFLRDISVIEGGSL